MTSVSEAGIVYITSVRLVARYDAVLYPFDVMQLLGLLPQKGWVVPTKRTEGAVSLEAQPSKGGMRLRFDQGNKTLGVEGGDLAEVLTGFKDVIQFAESLGELPPEVKTDFVEFQYVGRIKAKRNPVEVMSSHFNDSPRVAKVTAALKHLLPVLGEGLGLYSLHLAPRGLEPNRPEWAELTISPTNIYGNDQYHFDLIFRSEDRAAAEQVAENAHDILKALIREIEAD